MKKVFVVFVALLLALGVVACTPKPADSGIYYDLELNIADDLESVAFSETVRLVSDGAPAVFNLWANSYREGAAYPAYYTSLGKYGGLEITSLAVNGAEVQPVLSESAEHLTVEHGAAARQEVTVTIVGTVEIPHCNYRLGLYNGVLKFLNAYPVLAVNDGEGPRYDHYSRVGDPFYAEAADYTVKIEAPADLVLAFSADSRTDAVVDGERQTVEAKIDHIRDFALMGSRSWKESTAIVGETLVRYYAATERPERAELTAEVLERFSNVLGDYPWHQYTVAEAPFYYGGMEYGGFSLIADDISDWQEVLIHETAHQWFYGIVGSDQINAAWLDEGLATFVTDYYLCISDDADGYDAAMKQAKRQYANFINANTLTDPDFNASLARPISEFATNYEYSMLVYTKGGLMFDALYQLLGPKKIEAGLAAYCSANAWQLATPDDFYAAFKKATGQDIKGLIEPWLDDKVVMESFSFAV